MTGAVGDITAQLLQDGRAGEAEAYCEEQFRRFPNDAEVLKAIIRLRLSQGRREEALSMIQAALTADPSWIDGYWIIGQLLYERARYADAAYFLRQAVALAPGSFEANFFLGLALVNGSAGQMSQVAEGQAYLELAAQIAPNQADAWKELGHAYIHSSRTQEACDALRRALELAPERIDAMQLLATALMEEEEHAEALHVLERALALAPANPAIRTDRDRLKEIVQPRKSEAGRIARYPRSVKEFANLRGVIDKYILSEFIEFRPRITPATKIFTLGSCFAVNIATTLSRRGFEAKSVDYPEHINSTYENRFLLDWIAHGPSAKTQGFDAAFGEGYRQKVAALIRNAPIVILSLGVAPCFFDKATKEFASAFVDVNLHVALLLAKYEFRTTTVAENVENLKHILALLRELNPSVHLVLTVSPVPLKATFEMKSAVIADCVSKTTLRAAAHEFMQLSDENVSYWPSFEIVRWLSGHTGQVFGNDDGSSLHVAQAMVELIIDCFVTVYGTKEAQALAASP
jgi:tetratricopeptide (TPR) repeat protein